jgi:2,3-dihydroxybenzoate-AMP ligase
MLDGCTPWPAEFADRYIRDRLWRAETIAEAIFESAQRTPDSVALADERGRLTYRELCDAASRLSARFHDLRLAAADRIIVQIPNRIEFAVVTIASFAFGLIPVMALPAYRRAELDHIAEVTNARAIAVAPEYRGFDHAALAREIKSRHPSIAAIFSTEAAAGCEPLFGDAPAIDRSDEHGDPFDVALFLLSGGTTGLPKLIPRTHADYLYVARESARVCGVDRDSKIMIAIPAGHNFALGCPGLLGTMLAGGTVVLTQSADPETIAVTIARERITHLPCVPTIAMGLAALDARHRAMLSSMRVLTVGGQRLQEPSARELRRLFPHVRLQQVFGMAEGLVCYTALDDPDDIACTTQGRPISPIDELRIVDSDWANVMDGESGELLCRGPYTIRGYFRAAEHNRSAFTSDGFYRTGDIVRRHASGNLVVEGRVKDQINRGGEKIGAEEVEAHLMAHPAIAMAAVVAMPDDRLGEKVCAFVVLRDGDHIGLDELKDFLSHRGLARFKFPERLEVIDRMPLTNVGKIKKADLREMIARIVHNESGAAARPPGSRGIGD